MLWFNYPGLYSGFAWLASFGFASCQCKLQDVSVASIDLEEVFVIMVLRIKTPLLFRLQEEMAAASGPSGSGMCWENGQAPSEQPKTNFCVFTRSFCTVLQGSYSFIQIRGSFSTLGRLQSCSAYVPCPHHNSVEKSPELCTNSGSLIWDRQYVATATIECLVHLKMIVDALRQIYLVFVQDEIMLF